MCEFCNTSDDDTQQQHWLDLIKGMERQLVYHTEKKEMYERHIEQTRHKFRLLLRQGYIKK